MQESELIWHNGQLKPWAEATVHIMVHALHYGSSVFEGVRVYETPEGSRVFRLEEHTKRLFHSARAYRMEIPYTHDEINAACKEVVLKNGLKSAYLRPFAFRGYGTLGVHPCPEDPIETSIAAISWGAYLGKEGIENGVDVCVSSWQRVAPNTIPAGIKAGGNYLSSQLITMEAKRLGFAEGIGLSPDGKISEGAGENVFIIKDGTIYTPTAGASILNGLTRNAVITLARDAGYEVIEQDLPREMFYVCDEVFMTGTAAEVTPIKSVDRLDVGTGTRGPITKHIQDLFFGLFDGRTEDKWGWLQPLE